MDPIGYVLIAVVLGGLLYNFWRNYRIKAQGIEADGFITRVEETDPYAMAINSAAAETIREVYDYDWSDEIL